MEQQLDAFAAAPARARSSDPETSKAAAASVKNVRTSHRRVLAMFRAYGDMSDETLAKYLNEAAKETGIKLMSPSGVRSRRSELSKPNMDRIDEISKEIIEANPDLGPDVVNFNARRQLRAEGFRSPLWDTHTVDINEGGRKVIVWGIAK